MGAADNSGYLLYFGKYSPQSLTEFASPRRHDKFTRGGRLSAAATAPAVRSLLPHRRSRPTSPSYIIRRGGADGYDDGTSGSFLLALRDKPARPGKIEKGTDPYGNDFAFLLERARPQAPRCFQPWPKAAAPGTAFSFTLYSIHPLTASKGRTAIEALVAVAVSHRDRPADVAGRGIFLVMRELLVHPFDGPF